MDAPTRPQVHPASRLGLAAAAISGLTVCLYLVLIASEGKQKAGELS